MKKPGWFFLIAVTALSCDLQNLEDTTTLQNENLNISSTTSFVAGGYVVNSSTTDGFTFTIEIDQSGAQDISHLLFQFMDCEENYLTIDNVVSATVNGVSWPISGTTGSGTDCAFDNLESFIKFDNFNFEGGTVTVIITFDTQTASGSFLVKAGQGCYPYEIEGICETDEPCYEYQNETAWSAGARYVNKGNWATFTSYANAFKSVILYAGQTINIGTVSFTPSGSNVIITISLVDGWALAAGTDAVKIQSYSSAPTGTPSPGLFTTYKGNGMVVTVPAAAFFGVHIDAVLATEIECTD
jgi:hypothetical protein